MTVDLEYAIVVYSIAFLNDIVYDRQRRKRRLFQKIKLPSFKPAFWPPVLQLHEANLG
jgi:hypothetical protein